MSRPAPDFSPLLKNVIARHGLDVVSEATLATVLGHHQHTALFFLGDWERLAESNDVAAVLPELMKIAPGLKIAVVERGAERALQLRYRFNKFPALVFTRGEGYLGALLGMQDWSDYAREIPALLRGDVSEPPPFKFPEGCAPAPATGDTPFH